MNLKATEAKPPKSGNIETIRTSNIFFMARKSFNKTSKRHHNKKTTRGPPQTIHERVPQSTKVSGNLQAPVMNLSLRYNKAIKSPKIRIY